MPSCVLASFLSFVAGFLLSLCLAVYLADVDNAGARLEFKQIMTRRGASRAAGIGFVLENHESQIQQASIVHERTYTFTTHNVVALPKDMRTLFRGGWINRVANTPSNATWTDADETGRSVSR